MKGSRFGVDLSTSQSQRKGIVDNPFFESGGIVGGSRVLGDDRMDIVATSWR